MISFFRSKLGRVVVLGIFGIVLVAVVITGFGTGGMGGLSGSGSLFGGSSPTSIATIGSRDLPESEVSSLIDNRYRQLVQQQPTLDRATFIDEAYAPLLDQIIRDQSIVDFGRGLGFTVSQNAIDRVIVGIPAFANVAGQFDDAAFRQALQRQGITEQQLRDDIANSQIMRMAALPASSQIRAPSTVGFYYASLLLERRTGSIGVVPTEAIARGLNPTDQEIAAFYNGNRQLFQYGERRVMRYVRFGAQQFGDAVRANDQDIQQYYQQHQAEYGPVETRTLLRIILPTEQEARAFAQQVQGGTPFAQAAQAKGFAAADITFTNQRREQFTQTAGAEIANAAFGAQQGQLVGPARVATGFQVVRVEAINTTPARPLEQVRAEIVTAVERTKLQAALTAAAERIQTRLDDGASFDEIVAAEHLTVETTRPMMANGAGIATDQYQLPAELNPLLPTVFEMTAGEDPQLEVLQPDTLAVLLQLQQIVPPTVPPLEQVRDAVRARLIQQTALQRARAIADGIVSRINGGMAPAQAYAQAGIPLPPPQPVNQQRLQIAQAGRQVPPPLRILFSIPQGRARVVEAPNNAGFVIVHHAQRTPGDVRTAPNGRQLAATVQQSFSENAGAEMQEQLARSILVNTQVTRNDERIQALRQQLRSGGAAPAGQRR